MSTEQRQYEWGDLVWLDLKTKAIVIDCDEEDDNLPFRISTEKDDTDWVAADRLIPRDDDKPKAWRLPEVGDTIRVTGRSVHEDYKTQDYVITATNWTIDNPIRLDYDGSHIWLNPDDIKLVRLHDDPEPPAVHVVDANGMVEPTRPHSHYFSNGMEAIDVIRAFCSPEEIRAWAKIASTLYLLRDGKKAGTNDIEKAHWHLAQGLEARNGVD